jgi:hypothetical protein
MASDLMLGGNASWVWLATSTPAAGDLYGDAYCAEGYMGPLCAVCDPNGYYLDVSGDAPVNKKIGLLFALCLLFALGRVLT